ncbi:DUF7507 domain-containing protein [Algoriphagus hitonicola]|uniref:DUF7507 domain-containing protein n=1 Tax=Algoriphagus hitonicola TaxID=435880 RepID=UPI003616C803
MTNTASASTTYGDNTVPDTDDKTANADQTPALTIAKSITVARLTYDAVGDWLEYSYLITNSGNVVWPDRSR